MPKLGQGIADVYDFSQIYDFYFSDFNKIILNISHSIHVWSIYLHLPYFTIKNNQL